MYPSVQSDTAYKIIDKEGDRRYELANHLGNVLAVISDRKTGVGNGASYTSFEAITISATDYYPFGMSMPGRSFTAANTEGYRYSFNGKEDDTEWAKQDYGMRIYDKRIGRFLSIDPLAVKYPMLTPYQFASNTPIAAIDLDGLEAWVVRKTINSSGNAAIEMVFDKDLVPIGGVYESTRWLNKAGIIEAARWGTASYSDYKTQFPNDGKYTREDKKGLLTFEAGAQVLFGEVALEVSDFGFEYGVEGNLIKAEYASEKGAGLSSFIARDGPDEAQNQKKLIREDKDLKLGGGIGVGAAGIEYRKGINGKTGELGDSYIESDGPFFKADVNATKKDASVKIGIPESKISLGFGVKGWINLSINRQPQLSGYEKTEKKALESQPQGTKTQPDL